MSDRSTSLLDDPQVLSFVPILWVAWADGDLSATERAAIARMVSDAPWLRPEARRRIEAWLDPNNPPSATELAQIHDLVERARGTLGPHRRRSLVALGEAMAGAAPSPEALNAAAALATLLGMDAAAAPMAPPFAEVAVPHEALRAALDGERPEIRAQVRAFLDDPSRRMYGLDKDAQRDLVRGWLTDLAQTG